MDNTLTQQIAAHTHTHTHTHMHTMQKALPFIKLILHAMHVVRKSFLILHHIYAVRRYICVRMRLTHGESATLAHARTLARRQLPTEYR